MSENNDAAVQGPTQQDDTGAGSKRRTVLKAGLGAGLGLGFGGSLAEFASATTEKPPDKMRPQKGDRLVFISGDKKDQIIKPEDLTVGGSQILAYPIDPARR